MTTPFLLLVLAAAPLHPPVLAIDAAGFHEAERWDLSGASTLALTGAGGAYRTESPGYLETDSADAAPLPGECVAVLRSGEVFAGALEDSAQAGTLCLVSRDWGRLCFPMDAVASLTMPGYQTPSAADCAPCLVLANGDTLPGEIKRIGLDAVTVASPFGEVPTATERVAAVVLSAEAIPFDGRTGGETLVALTDGQRWFAGSVEGVGGDAIKVRRGEATALVENVRFRRLIFSGWRARLLTETGRPTVETMPALDEAVRVEADNGALVRNRWFGHRALTGGATVLPRSHLTWSVPGADCFLTGWVAQSPEAGPDSHAEARVESGGQVLWRAEAVTRAGGPMRFTVECAGGDVTLVTDFGDYGELGDVVNWWALLLFPPAGNETP